MRLYTEGGDEIVLRMLPNLNRAYVKAAKQKNKSVIIRPSEKLNDIYISEAVTYLDAKEICR